LTFARTELFELYTKICHGDENNLRTKEMEKSLHSLDEIRETIEDDIEVWLRPDFSEKVTEDPEDVPDLNGVPLSHRWWGSKQREQSNENYHSSLLNSGLKASS
jgi:hypothetical protein